MTHEYVIATGGWIEALPSNRDDDRPTAIGWAADSVLAVGSDASVRSISRGDSTFLDLGGCVVTALPRDPDRADTLVRDLARSGRSPSDVRALLEDAGLIGPRATLETGSRADLAFWGVTVAGDGTGGTLRGLVAVVRDGGFTEGDEHLGPFMRANER